MPANGQPSSGYLVATSDATILLDCGPGIATALGAVAAPDELSAVIVSHLHLDHCYDLLPLGKSLLARALRYPRAGEAPQTWADIDAVPLYVPAVRRRCSGSWPPCSRSPRPRCSTGPSTWPSTCGSTSRERGSPSAT